MSIYSHITPFASFSEDSVNDILRPHIISRTFEELITERGDLNINFTNDSKNFVDYTTLFDNIKEKLFKINNVKEIDITNCEDIKKFREDYHNLKKTICNVYMDLMDAETKLNEAKEKYTTFCESIKNCIHFVHNSGTEDENDLLIKNILEKKTDTYYISLNIEQLIKNFEKSYHEFEKLKCKITIISGTILPSTICQICLEHQVEYFIDPCGHTICKHCKIICEQLTDCHYCRTNKKGYKRLYL